jgi:hypothetical protein
VIDSELARLETEQGRLDQKRNRLLAARAALAGEAVVPSPQTSRVSRAEVTEYLRAHPGSSYTEVARGLGVKATTAAKHLSRGGKEGEYCKNGTKWSVIGE